MPNPILTLDVAHPPRSAEEVEGQLLAAWSQVRNSSSLRILKIIHGYGSKGTGSVSKELVRNWLFRRTGKVLAVIPGEEFSVFESRTQQMRTEVGQFDDPDLDRANPGVTYAWIK